jgi:hypothetical protein
VTDAALDSTDALRCAGCGVAGRMPTIVYDKANAPPGAPLTPVDCKSRFAKRRARR